ncbi:putative oxidoreductase, aryl-alcohol dehydrogenase like protein [Deinococcus peraridilitoris DSM 19664]|uniref:Putative oxidoreductase, aryl-alcohol dehydrogenase like protein n=2 Tax=Deinococcus TaxID=1298 RepID=L0A3C4_DEIPD|nr:putative oxidoreductase, aryl-alcohol dehydrogenase like protein [Deinococcus peraridilitoris DSM 19664]
MLEWRTMETRDFGRTGLRVSALGFGAGQIGSQELSEQEVGTILNQAVDLGITLIDTARGYGLSEERIGRHLSGRRQEFVLSSKGGYGAEGAADWTPEAVRLGIEQALRRLNTDVIDIFHLHSCPLDTLRHDDLLAALERARAEGLIRVAAYSGENEALAWAVSSGRFGSVQTSVNLADQWSSQHVLPEARQRGLGVIAKRPIANAAWQYTERPTGQYAETYWLRLQEMRLDPGELAWDEFALRFSAFSPGVSSVIVGTASARRLERNVALLQRGPLDREHREYIQAKFARHGLHWAGEV